MVILWIMLSLVVYHFVPSVSSLDGDVIKWLLLIFPILSGFYLYIWISIYRPISFSMKNYEIIMILGWSFINLIKIGLSFDLDGTILSFNSTFGIFGITIIFIIIDIFILIRISLDYEEKFNKWIKLEIFSRNEAKGKEIIFFITIQMILLELAIFTVFVLLFGCFSFAFIGAIIFCIYHQKHNPSTQDLTKYVRLVFFSGISGSTMGIYVVYIYYLGEIFAGMSILIDIILLLISLTGIVAFYAHFAQIHYYPIEKYEYIATGENSHTKKCNYCSTPFQEVNITELIDQGKSTCRFCGTKLYKYEVVQLEEKEMLEEHEKILTDFNKKLIIDLDNLTQKFTETSIQFFL